MYALSDDGRDFLGAARIEVGGGWEWLLAPPWDVEWVAASADGRLLGSSTNEDGFSRLRVRDLATGRESALEGAPPGVLDGAAFAPRGSRLGFVVDSPLHPSDLYVADLPGGPVRRLTDSLPAALGQGDMVLPRTVRFPGPAGPVPALLYEPRCLERGDRAPAVVVVHGGSEEQERPVYYPNYQHWLDRGIAVLCPNFRGSSGFGRDYQLSIRRNWGGPDIEDLAACVAGLRELPWIEPDRIACCGASFGGFGVLSLATRFPGWWAAAVAICAPADLVSFCRNVPAGWRSIIADRVGDPDADAERLASRSPIARLDRLRCPLLVIHGANDRRVPRAETDRMVELARARGVEVQYLVFEDEGHSISHHRNRARASRTVDAFFGRHLLGNGRAPP